MTRESTTTSVLLSSFRTDAISTTIQQSDLEVEVEETYEVLSTLYTNTYTMYTKVMLCVVI